MDWLQRLRQRKLAQWTVGYCAGAWAVLQVLDFLTAQFGWPSFILRALTIVLAVGAAVVFVVAWFHGERGDQRIPTIEIALVAALLVAAGAGVIAVRGGADSSPATPVSAIASNAGDDAALAVLPFRNLSGDPGQEFFSDGFTEELSSALAGVDGLRVVAPSAFQFTGKEADVRALAIEAGALYMLEGSVRRASDQVRVTSTLVDMRNNRQVFSHTYARQLTPANILALQEQIAQAIVSALKVAIRSNDTEAILSLGTNNQEALDAYLRGVGALAPVTRESNAIAAREFARAIALDSMFARAHAALAFAQAGYWRPRSDDPNRATILKQAKRSALRALQLDSTLADPHVVLANLSMDPREERAHLDAAIRNDPASRWPRLLSASLWGQMGDRTRAVGEVDRLLALDPFSPWSHIMAANIRNLMGQYARADSALDRAEQLAAMGFGPYPKWPLHWNRGYAAIMRDDFETAGRHFLEGYAPEFGELARTTGSVLTRIAEIQRSVPDSATRRRLAADVVEANESHLQAQIAAMLYLRFSDKDRLYRLMDRKPSEIFWPTAVYDSLRGEARFIELSKKAAS